MEIVNKEEKLKRFDPRNARSRVDHRPQRIL